jgi:hypothetical protein
VIDCEVLTLDEAKLLKFIEECYKIWRIARSGAQKGNAIFPSRLLRKRGKRPHHG